MEIRQSLNATAVISEGGRLVIPSDMRKAMGIEPGNEVVLFLDENGELRVMTRKRAIEWAQEALRKYVPAGVSLVDELIKDREEEAANE